MVRTIAVAVLSLSLLASACASATPPSVTEARPGLGVGSVVLTEAGEACVDFYRSTQESVEEEAVYMRVFR